MSNHYPYKLQQTFYFLTPEPLTGDTSFFLIDFPLQCILCAPVQTDVDQHTADICHNRHNWWFEVEHFFLKKVLYAVFHTGRQWD